MNLHPHIKNAIINDRLVRLPDREFACPICGSTVNIYRGNRPEFGNVSERPALICIGPDMVRHPYVCISCLHDYAERFHLQTV